MTRNRFEFIKENFSKYNNHLVEFKYYIPSADKMGKARGYLKAVGTGCNEDCFIIGERGLTHAIYYDNVKLVGDNCVTLRKNGTVGLYKATIGTWRCIDVWGHCGNDHRLYVHYIYEADLINGSKPFVYSANELKAAILNTIEGTGFIKQARRHIEDLRAEQKRIGVWTELPEAEYNMYSAISRKIKYLERAILELKYVHKCEE